MSSVFSKKNPNKSVCVQPYTDMPLNSRGGGGGTPLYKLYKLCDAPKGMVFEPFLSENGYRF